MRKDYREDDLEREATVLRFSLSTMKTLAAAGVPPLIFPLKSRSKYSYHESPRCFGAKRSGGRLHAGVDLYGNAGAPIFALASGTIKAVSFFNVTGKKEHAKSVSQIVIDHGAFTARYCEVANDFPAGIKAGGEVNAGDHIGYIGNLAGVINWPHNMLHLEIYGGFLTGGFTDVNNPPYKRRADLLDPTPFIDRASMLGGYFDEVVTTAAATA